MAAKEWFGGALGFKLRFLKETHLQIFQWVLWDSPQWIRTAIALVGSSITCFCFLLLQISAAEVLFHVFCSNVIIRLVDSSSCQVIMFSGLAYVLTFQVETSFPTQPFGEIWWRIFGRTLSASVTRCEWGPMETASPVVNLWTLSTTISRWNNTSSRRL